MSKLNYISFAKKSASIQINELKKSIKFLIIHFIKAVELILNTKSKVIFSLALGKILLFVEKQLQHFQVWEFQVFLLIQQEPLMEIWVKLKKKIF